MGALGLLRAWLTQQGKDKAKLEGREKTRTVGMVKNTRYTVDHKKLNALLDPETRTGIVTENVSHYLRVSLTPSDGYPDASVAERGTGPLPSTGNGPAIKRATPTHNPTEEQSWRRASTRWNCWAASVRTRK